MAIPQILDNKWLQNSATGTRTRVARVRAEYPNQLDYSGPTIQFGLFVVLVTHVKIWHVFSTRIVGVYIFYV